MFTTKMTSSGLLVALAMMTACGDDTTVTDSGAPGDTSTPDDTSMMGDSNVVPDGGGDVPPNPDAEWITADMLTFDEAIPGVVGMATVWGDRAMGEHETIIKVTAMMEIPPHMHTLGIHALVLGGPMVIPVPSNELDPVQMMNSAYAFVPPTAQHSMGCPASEDCLFLVHQAGTFDLNLDDTPSVGDAPRNPEAKQMALEDMTFVDIIPGVVQFAPVVGDFTMEEHGTIVKVTMGMGIPAHWHTMAARGYVLQGDVEVPVPFDQTIPTTMQVGSYFFVPAMAPHAMNCVSDDMDCYFYLRQSGAFDFNPIAEGA